MDVYTMTANRIKVWATAITAVLVLFGMVFAAARLARDVEIQNAIQEECEPPSGHIYREIESRSEMFLEEVQGVIQDDLDVFDGRFEKLDAEMKAQHDLGIRLEMKQIAIEDKMDDDKEDLIREIRRAGGGS